MEIVEVVVGFHFPQRDSVPIRHIVSEKKIPESQEVMDKKPSQVFFGIEGRLLTLRPVSTDL